MRDEERRASAEVSPNQLGLAREVVLRAVARQPGIGRHRLVEAVRDELGLPSGTAFMTIAALEREGTLAPRRAGRAMAYKLSDPTGIVREELLDELAGRGNGGAISSFYDARSAAVMAYCSRVCSPDQIADAVEGAFAAFLDALGTGEAGEDADLDELLARATRANAAERATAPDERVTRPACAAMPRLLAARASGLLAPEEASRVWQHLEECATCRAAERSFNEAEDAFRALAERTSMEEIGNVLETQFHREPAMSPEAEAGGEPEVAAIPAPPSPPRRDGARATRRAVASPARGTPGKPVDAGPAARLPRPDGIERRHLLLAGYVLGGVLLLVSLGLLGRQMIEAFTSGDSSELPAQSRQAQGGGGGTEEPATPATDLKVFVLNGAGTEGLAASTASLLEDKGVKVEDVDDAAEDVEESVVLFAPETKDDAIKIGKKVDISNVQPIDDANREIVGEGIQIVVVAGPDLAGGGAGEPSGEEGNEAGEAAPLGPPG